MIAETKPHSISDDKVVIYQTEDGQAALDVHLQQETVWVTQKQMSALFDKDVRTVNEHIKNIFSEGELDSDTTIRKFRIVQTEGKRQVTRLVEHYDLDVIISVGYRIKSQRGTQFRRWATRVLRDHIVQGYTLNQKRLAEQTQQIAEMHQAISLLSRTLEQQQLVNDLGKDVLRVISDYAYALNLLDRYDHGTLKIEGTSDPAEFVLDYASASHIVQSMKGDFDGLFGIEKDQGFKSAIGTIYQTLMGRNATPVPKRKPPTFYILWSRIMHSVTATNALLPPFSSTF